MGAPASRVLGCARSDPREATEVPMIDDTDRRRNSQDVTMPRARPRDTSVDIHTEQIARYRAMSPERKLEIVFDLSAAVDALLVAGIRQRRPQLDDAGVRAEMVRLKYGATLP